METRRPICVPLLQSNHLPRSRMHRAWRQRSWSLPCWAPHHRRARARPVWGSGLRVEVPVPVGNAGPTGIICQRESGRSSVYEGRLSDSGDFAVEEGGKSSDVLEMQRSFRLASLALKRGFVARDYPRSCDSWLGVQRSSSSKGVETVRKVHASKLQ
jgi:hypothetical protein